MDKKQLSERDICTKYIATALEKAGWDVTTQVREEFPLTKGRIIVRGKLHTRAKHKRADYVLFYKPNITCHYRGQGQQPHGWRWHATSVGLCRHAASAICIQLQWRRFSVQTMRQQWDEPQSELVMLSMLEHYAYCSRQCALIHVEKVWDENLYTLRGRDVHERVDEVGGESRQGVRIKRALPIWCKRLGLVGKADVVEFIGSIPCPVEYKSGRARKGRPETLQLCAQALCLEEMFGVAVPQGAIYWHGSKERGRKVARELFTF